MIDRRKIMIAAMGGLMLPFRVVRAQPGPEPYREGPPRDEPRQEDHRPPPRPHMPPPRHEERPSPPGREGWHWHEGHWSWNGRQWVWIRGRWYR